MDENLCRVTAEFITERVNYHGQQEPGNIGAAAEKLYATVEKLRQTLTDEQILTLRDCENFFAEVDGETMRYYFKAGFGDAVRFLLDWGKHPSQ